MRFTEGYFPQYVEAMDEVESVMDMGCPFDERTRRPIAFASAIRESNRTVVKT